MAASPSAWLMSRRALVERLPQRVLALVGGHALRRSPCARWGSRRSMSAGSRRPPRPPPGTRRRSWRRPCAGAPAGAPARGRRWPAARPRSASRLPRHSTRAGVGAHLAIRLQHVGGPRGDALEHGAEEVAARVRQVEADEGALRLRIVDGRPLAREVGQAEEAPGRPWGWPRPRATSSSKSASRRQLVAEPAGQRARGREAGHRGVRPGNEPRRVPQPRVADRPVGDLDDEDRRAVHEHHLAGRLDAHAHAPPPPRRRCPR